MSRRGVLLFVDREVFDVHVVVDVNQAALQDVWYTILHIFTITVSEPRNARRPVVHCQALSSPKPKHTYG